MRHLSSILLFSSLCACTLGTYRVVQVAPGTGEVALTGLESDARPRAEQYMASQCPGGYDIVEQHEVIVGQDETSSTQTSTDKKGREHSETKTSTEDRREWHMRYQCKPQGAATDKAAQPASSAPPAPSSAPAEKKI